MAYGDFKDLKRRRAADVLRDKAFNIAKTPKYDGYQRGLAFMVYNFFLIKRLKAVVSHLEINLLLNLYLKMNNQLKNVVNLLLKKFKKGKYIQHSKTIFGLQMGQICN